MPRCPGYGRTVTSERPAPLDEDSDDDLDEDDYDELELPAPHPAFLRAFPDQLYEDQSDALTPFGSDEGWDAVAELVEDFLPLDDDAALRDLADDVLELEDEEFDATDLQRTRDTDPALIGIGFAILRLTGRLDEEGLDRLIAAVDRQRRRYGHGNPTLSRIAADLASFAGR